MSKLVKELKHDHQEITGILIALQEAGLSSKKGFDLLLKSKDKLLGHLTKEDKYLYPPLHA